MLPQAVSGSTWICCIIFLGTASAVYRGGRWQPRSSWIPKSCEAEQCYPSTGDLLVGRERRLISTSTCGLHGPERFCTVSLEPMHRASQCLSCDSTKPYHSSRNIRSHRIDNIVTPNRKDPNRWWQSENGIENVALQLDLEAEFHFTHLMMRFKTFRPQAMLIERSSDFGRSWKTYRYFADNCTAFWPGIRAGQPSTLTEVVCEERYSGETPSSNGEVVFRALPSANLSNPWAEEVQNLLKITNLRINFTKLRTLGDDLLDNRPEVKDKYYYAMYNMVVRGSCSCYGHAANCVPLETLSHDTPNMVYGRCNCTHNTKGNNCEKCADFYWDAPWRPAIGSNPNECRKCNCNSHATRCHFDASIYAASGLTSGGVCDDCADNTEGIHCERCKPHYYLVDGRVIYEKDACQPCDCDPAGQFQECDWLTNMALGLTAGRCYCRTNVGGPRCDTCKGGFFNLTTENIDGCQACDCYWPGVLRLSEIDSGDDETNSLASQLPPCDPVTGVCTCKRNVMGERCQECISYHYWKMPEVTAQPEDTEGCLPCQCDLGGAFGSQCNLNSGICSCRPHLVSRTCNKTETGYWLPSLDSVRLEAEETVNIEGNWKNVEIGPSSPGVRAHHTGTGHVLLWEDSTLYFEKVRVPFPTHYDVILRYKLEGDFPWRQIEVKLNRSTPASLGSGICAGIQPEDDMIDTEYHGVEISPTRGAFVGKSLGTFCLEPEQSYSISFRLPEYSQPEEATFFEVDSIVLMPSQSQIPLFQVTTAEVEAIRDEFIRERCSETLYNVNDPAKDLNPTCQKLVFSVVASMTPALPCECDSVGSSSNECFHLGGQCPCRENFIGRQCDRCAPHTYRPPGSIDCVPCDCSETGSLNRSCDNSTGQCPCHKLVEGRTCEKCQIGYFGFPRCQECACNGFSEQCREPDGVCLNCREYTSGPHCTTCNDTFYGDPLRYREMGWDSPCRRCNCPGVPPHGPQHADTCSLITSRDSSRGVLPQDFMCHCHDGYTGQYCDQCSPNYFGRPASTDILDACSPCQCNGHIELADSGNCDSTNGTCIKCLHSTVGDHCERCAPFYWGNASDSNLTPADRCKPCLCFVLGVNVSVDCPSIDEWRDGYGQCSCLTLTGQCNCLANITGYQCDRCLPAHYGLATGMGCKPCLCDSVGAESESCTDEGVCTCKEGFGGNRCNECPDGKWGNPHINQCRFCDCDPIGTINDTICEKKNGQCKCRPGITGIRCDRCARGTTGDNPSNCEPCGECFDNWDVTLKQLKGNASQLYVEAEEVKKTGVSTAFAAEFSDAEEAITNAENAIAAWPVLRENFADLRKEMGSLAGELMNGDGCLDQEDYPGEEDEDFPLVPERSVDKLCSVSQEQSKVLSELDVWRRTATVIGARIENMQKEVENYNVNATSIYDAADAGANQTIAEEAEGARKDAEAIEKFAKDRETQAAVERNQLEKWFEQSQQRLSESSKQLTSGVESLETDLDAFEQKLGNASSRLCLGDNQQCSLFMKNAQTALKEGRTLIQQRTQEANGKLTVLNTQVSRLKEISSAASSYLAMGEQVCSKLNSSKTEISSALADAEKLLKCTRAGDVQVAEDCGVRPEDLSMIEKKLEELNLDVEEDDFATLLSNLTKAAETISTDTDAARLLAETEPQLEAAERIKESAQSLKNDTDKTRESLASLESQFENAIDPLSEMSEKLDEGLVSSSKSQSDIAPVRSQELGQIESTNLASEKTIDSAKRDATALHGDFMAAKDSITRFDSHMADVDKRRQVARQNLSDIERRLDEISKKLNIESPIDSSQTLNNSQGMAGKLASRASAVANELARIRGRQTQVLSDLNSSKRKGKIQEEQLREITSRMQMALKELARLHSHHATCNRGQPVSLANSIPLLGGNQPPQLRPRFQGQRKKRYNG